MDVDCFLKIGMKHKICEDYIITGKIGYSDDHYIILSDGCSMSKHTDVGARLLVHEAKRALCSEHGFCLSTWENIIKAANYIAVALLGLPEECMDATLISAYTRNEFIHVNVFGDGVVIAKHKDGSMTYYNIVYPSNAPYYLSYTLSNKRRVDYIKDFGKEKLVYKIGDGYNVCLDGAFDEHTSIIFRRDDIDTVMIASDGILSFGKDLGEIANDFTKFANSTGEYLKRRVSKAIKTYAKDNINHYDDISIGSFCL